MRGTPQMGVFQQPVFIQPYDPISGENNKNHAVSFKVLKASHH